MRPKVCGIPCATAKAFARSYGGRSRSIRSYEEIFLRRHASSKATNPGRKSASKPLPYQPAKPKAQVNPSAQQNKSKKAPVSELLRDRWIGLLGYGGAILCLGYFTASLTMYWRQEPAPCYPLGCEPEAPTGRPSIQSPYEFDLHLDKSEWRFGITKLRRELSSAARGHVLEVAIGTGRNLEFYDWSKVAELLVSPKEREKAKAKSSGWMPSWGDSKKANTGQDRKEFQDDDSAVLSFTGVDISPGMLDIALRRMRQVIPYMSSQIPKKPSFAILAAKPGDSDMSQAHTVSLLSNRIRVLQSDVQSALPAPPALASASPSDSKSSISASTNPQKYDTILQTFGLCSVQDPVSLLSHMAMAIQPNTGRILLLEHGRSVWDLVNGLLDRGARGHHERFGCWWNRDIEVIVNEAARRVPGLEILRLERPGWTTAGTHVVVELRVKGNGKNTNKDEEVKKQEISGWGSILPSMLSTKPTSDSDNED
ncbi:hypothetical protein F5Y19DRAFT_140070 [Xylariaceae sp. FL1651]|nr:hypothetical protein F5Y19DRAFT_140070 [Xylariaceae sp. FL1651]